MRFTPVFRHTAFLLTLAGAGCGSAEPVTPFSPASTIQAGRLTIVAGMDGISLSNQTERPVYFVAFESELATLIDWIPCTGGPNCNVAVQGEHRVLQWSSIMGFSPAKTRYLVYWWNTEVGTDGRVRVTNIQSAAVSR